MSEPVVGRSLWQDALRRLRRNRLAVWGGRYVVFVAVACGVIPSIPPVVGWFGGKTTIGDWRHQDTAAQFQPPSFGRNDKTGRVHLFGTDDLGRDLFARCFYGGRLSLGVGIVATLVAVIVGTIYGAVAGYAGGRIDYMMMRAVDVLYGLPYMFLVILIVVAFDKGLFAIFAALGLFMWLTTARIVRGQVLGYKKREFVQAARVIGASRTRIIFRHLLPNVMGPVIVYSTLSVPAVILMESFLSFLGLGVQEPKTSWGLLAADGSQAINPLQSYWWVILFPSLFLATTLLALNFLGDGLRDALDPKGRRD
jgi:oligopeptide transport system permease protein